MDEGQRPVGSIAREYAAGLDKMRQLRDGSTLLAAATSVLPRLPDGPLLLLSTSVEGTALVAVCAALRERGDTAWARIDLTAPPALRHGQHAVFVEPVDPGEGWRSAVLARYPDAEFATSSFEQAAAPALVA